jgi:hypothetical protein
MSLKNVEGAIVTSHEEKTNILWSSFKDRLGTSEFTHMYFNLNELLQRENDLSVLVSSFTHEEINGIVMNLPSRKSPWPDGFNTDFMKKCWGHFSGLL